MSLYLAIGNHQHDLYDFDINISSNKRNYLTPRPPLTSVSIYARSGAIGEGVGTNTPTTLVMGASKIVNGVSPSRKCGR